MGALPPYPAGVRGVEFTPPRLAQRTGPQRLHWQRYACNRRGGVGLLGALDVAAIQLSHGGGDGSLKRGPATSDVHPARLACLWGLSQLSHLPQQCLEVHRLTPCENSANFSNSARL